MSTLPPVSDMPPFAQPQTRPDNTARILATVIVAAVTATVMTKMFGKKAGVAALLVTTAAHEYLDAPLARQLSRLGL